jgi:hypothetical protein
MNDEATEEDLKIALHKELEELDLVGVDFPNEKIRENWLKDMNHFCENYRRPYGYFTTEELILYKLNEDVYLQGYTDLIRHNNDDTISIFDYKTSTDFDNESLIKAGRQLCLYAMAKEQEGNKVKLVAWIMVKYCEVTFMGKTKKTSKSETTQSKVINRGKLVSELKPYLEKNLYDLGYDEFDVENMLTESLKNNSLSNLPSSVIDKYTIKPYVRKYELTDEVRRETIEYITEMIKRFENKSDKESEWKVKNFTKYNKSGKAVEDTFFCTVLCNHRKSCPHIKKFLDTKDSQFNNNDEDLF